MLEQLTDFIKQNNLFKTNEKILLAVSGGVDSVVMAHLFHELELPFGIAHCNFCLRNNESNADEYFVKNLAEKLNVPFYCSQFETNSYAIKKGISIQMAARNLRYNWFEQIRTKEGFSKVVVATHKNDEIETILLNLTKGTGLAGLHGIYPKRGHIIRPLLFATKDEIEAFAKASKIEYRIDTSNASIKYERNRIRHQVIPALKEINPKLEATFTENVVRFRATEQLVKQEIDQQKKRLVKQTKEGIQLSIEVLNETPHANLILFETLKPFGFNGDIISNIVNALNAEPGKVFYSNSHMLVKDRMHLILQEKTKNSDLSIVFINQTDREIDAPVKLKLSSTINDHNIIPNSSVAMLDQDKLSFPLSLRKWQYGDAFFPLGMDQRKKLSDFFIDSKIPVSEKGKIMVLCSNEQIVWVVGHRVDNRYKVTKTTEKVYIAELILN